MSSRSVVEKLPVALSEAEALDHLCRLALSPDSAISAYEAIRSISPEARQEFLKLADSHHVVIRSLEPLSRFAVAENNSQFLDWANEQLVREKARIENALIYLHAICAELENAGCPVVVIKTLEHWPDLGNDLDLYTTGNPSSVIDVFQKNFRAHVEPRSWGDRFAQKWNFAIPGLPESVEVHVQRLGQMGEHVRLAHRFVSRRVMKAIGSRTFRVPAPEEAVVVATLQRMYRHFYFRVCDIANSAQLVRSGEIDYAELKRSTDPAGIWPGVASYLVVVADYVKRYTGEDLPLPAAVKQEAECNGSAVHPKSRFLRVPIMPHGAQLYLQQVTRTAMNGNLAATARLSLLPYLATAAAISYRLTGSDKGVW